MMRTRVGWPAGVLVLLLAISGAPAHAGSEGSSLPPSNRIPWRGGHYYLHGANLPWYHRACDFGCGSDRGGVSAPAVQTALRERFQFLKGLDGFHGTHVVRWWAFPDEAWQITRDGAGAPAGVTPAVYADFDAALALADEFDVYYVFVLFSSPTAIPSAWLTDPAQRTQLATALSELFARYKDHPRVLTWEIFNEPERDIWRGAVAQAPVQATVRELAAAVHAHSAAYVTVGSAALTGVPLWIGQGLDYYTARWDEEMASGEACAPCTDYATVKARYQLDAPLVIGGFPAKPSTDAGARFEEFYEKSYAGAWASSLFPERTDNHPVLDLDALRDFATQHCDLGPQGTATPPPPAPTIPVP